MSLPSPQENHSPSESEARLFKSDSPFVKYRSHCASASLMTPCTTGVTQGVTVHWHVTVENSRKSGKTFNEKTVGRPESDTHGGARRKQ